MNKESIGTNNRNNKHKQDKRNLKKTRVAEERIALG